MRFAPILLLHICAGTVGFVSGAVAIAFRKGSRRHGIAGDVFVVSMLILAATGTYLALVKQQPGNVLGGTLTFYLVATAWATARRRNPPRGISEWAGFAAAAAIAAVALTWCVEAARSATGLKEGYAPGPYGMLGSIALLASVGDLRMLVRGGISGASRIARHLWRMCFALFIAAASIFLARQQLFPSFLRKTGILAMLSFAPLALMIFWFLRIRLWQSFGKEAKLAEFVSPPEADADYEAAMEDGGM
jgi:energy-converting hydrogenase Eha subunit G